MRGTIWITGISASGKTTIGKMFVAALAARGHDNIEHLDGDEVRTRIGGHYDHSLEDREKVLKIIVRLAKDLTQNGQLVVVSTISHKKSMRKFARSEIHRFIEVFLDCPSVVCEGRDVKGRYKKAREKKTVLFVGVNTDYEKSDYPDLVLKTGEEIPEDSVNRLLDFTLNCNNLK